MTNKNIQFNTSDAKAFRNTLAKYHVAMHKINNYANRRNDDVKATRTILENYLTDKKALEDGKYEGHMTMEDIDASIVLYTAQLEKQQSDFADAKAKCEKETKSAIDLVKNDEKLYNSYVAYADAHFTDDTRKVYANEIATFFKDNGLSDATADNCTRFATAIGGRKNSAKKSYESKSLVGAVSKSQFITLFLGNLVDVLADEQIITPAKYTYVPKSIRDKENKKNK